MRLSRMLGLLVFLAAAAAPSSVAMTCREDVTRISYAGGVQPTPPQYIVSSVAYVLDFERPSISVRSGVASGTFVNGVAGRHISVDADGLTLASTTVMAERGPEILDLMHFARDGSHAEGTRDMRINGQLRQHADMTLTCRPAG